MLYAMKRANADDSTTLVCRRANPIKVRNTNAVMAAPRRVDESGDVATVENDYRRH